MFSVHGFRLGGVRIVTSTLWISHHLFLRTRPMFFVETRTGFGPREATMASASQTLLFCFVFSVSIDTRGGVVHFATRQRRFYISVGFCRHIAARLILDQILLSVLYGFSPFYDHVMFYWTWIHR